MTRILLLVMAALVADARPGRPPCPPPATYAWGDGFVHGILTIESDCNAAVRFVSDGGEPWWTERIPVTPTAAGLDLQLTEKLRRERVPAAYTAIRWGVRRYLIPTGASLSFCNLVNAGREPSRFAWMFAIDRAHDAAASGRPEVPPSWRPYLLARPIEGLVLAGSGSMVHINRGSRHGLLPGMIVYVSNPRRPNVSAEMTVRSADVDSAQAKIDVEFGRVRKGDSFSTREPR